MKHRKADRRRALLMLANMPRGQTLSFLLLHGFTAGLLAELANAGLITAHRDRTFSPPPIEETRVQITDAGRKQLTIADPATEDRSQMTHSLRPGHPVQHGGQARNH